MKPLSAASLVAGCSTLLAFVTVCGPRPPSFVAALVFALGLSLRGRFQLPLRPQLALAAALLLAVWLTGERPAAGTGYISSLSFRAAAYLVLLLGIAPVFLYDTQRERGYCCVAVVGLMIALVSYSSQTMVAAAPVLLQIVALSYWLRQHMRPPGTADPNRHRPGVDRLAFATLIPTLAVASGLCVVLQWSETKVNLLYSLMSSAPVMNFSFSSKSTLSTFTRSQMNPAVALRYFSPRPSTHLVARCYSHYANATWSSSDEAVQVTGESVAGGYRYLRGSPLPDALEERIELAGAAPDRPMPRDAWGLTISSARAERCLGDCFRDPQGKDQRDYHMQRSAGRFPVEFGPDSRALLLDVPGNLTPTLKGIADQWCAETQGKEELTPIKRCTLLEKYFHEHFQYGFGYPFSKSQEPILDFLQQRPAAHCEMFASALALMLRCYSIPTRYINGFLVVEHTRLGGYSIVRARHAHAWVEAYLDGYGWILLDPTPPQFTQGDDDLFTDAQSLSDIFFYHWNRLMQMSWAEMAQAALEALKRVAPAVLGMWAIYWLWSQWGRWSRRPRTVPDPGQRSRQALGQLLDQVESELRLLGWTRPPNQTLLNWAQHFEGQGPVTEFLRDYCGVFYGQSQATAADMERLAGKRDAIQQWAQQQLAAQTESSKPARGAKA